MQMCLCVYAFMRMRIAGKGEEASGEGCTTQTPQPDAQARLFCAWLRVFLAFCRPCKRALCCCQATALGALGYGIPVHKRILYAKWRPGPAASIFFSLLASCSCEAGGLLVRAPVAVLCVPLCNNWRRDPGGDDSAYVSVSVRAFACVWKGTGTGTGCASPASSASRDAPGVQRSVGRGCCSSR